MNRKLILIITCLLLSSCRLSSEEIVKACTATANSYAYLRDQLLYEHYGALFTEDAVFQIEGRKQVVGREAIIDALKKRGPNNVMRHHSHVVHMQAVDNETAHGISYLTVWSVDSEAYNQGVKTVEAPFIVGEYHDEFRIEDNKCLISNRFAKIIFMGKKQVTL